MNDRRIPVEICLTSNVQTHAVESFESHPLRSYFDAGLLVSLHTDNRLMSGTTMTRELERAARHLSFNPAELAELILNGFRSAFLPWQDKRVLLSEVTAEVATLRVRQASGDQASPER